jgi:2-oxoglutarate dehydrogenase E1 component
VLLLPHGYEGQGPDHSSGRIERFLTMTAGDAMRIAEPSTPASYFHLLRLHSLSAEHIPLIVFTPKSMLRNKRANSMPADLTGDSAFRPVIGDADVTASSVERVLLCSGKITWELRAERQKRSDTRTAIVPVEQLYPLAATEIATELNRYPSLREVRWVQDEPRNMGAWPFMALNLRPHLDGRPLSVVSRPASTSPAVGSASQHQAEHRELMDQAFA